MRKSMEFSQKSENQKSENQKIRNQKIWNLRSGIRAGKIKEESVLNKRKECQPTVKNSNFKIRICSFLVSLTSAAWVITWSKLELGNWDAQKERRFGWEYAQPTRRLCKLGQVYDQLCNKEVMQAGASVWPALQEGDYVSWGRSMTSLTLTMRELNLWGSNMTEGVVPNIWT